MVNKYLLKEWTRENKTQTLFLVSIKKKLSTEFLWVVQVNWWFEEMEEACALESPSTGRLADTQLFALQPLPLEHTCPSPSCGQTASSQAPLPTLSARLALVYPLACQRPPPPTCQQCKGGSQQTAFISLLVLLSEGKNAYTLLWLNTTSEDYSFVLWGRY